MDSKQRKYIIEKFGCKTPVGDDWVLTSMGNASTVPADEFWNVFSGDAEKYFDIRKSENEKELSLTLDNTIRKRLERELLIMNILQ